MKAQEVKTKLKELQAAPETKQVTNEVLLSRSIP